MATTQTPITHQSARKNTGALERITLRNEFYRDKFRTMATATPILVIALLVSISLNVVLATKTSEKFFFTVDGAGRVVPVRALNEPYVTESFLINWVNEKVARAYSLDPQNFRRQTADLAPDFTPDGYKQYVGSLIDSGTIDFMTKNLLVSTAVPLGAPVVIDRGEVNGVYFWKVQVPMLVQYRSAIKGAEKHRQVTVTVVRRQTLENPLGIGINQFVAYDAETRN